jgi:hypothetical protein
LVFSYLTVAFYLNRIQRKYTGQIRLDTKILSLYKATLSTQSSTAYIPVFVLGINRYNTGGNLKGVGSRKRVRL